MNTKQWCYDSFRARRPRAPTVYNMIKALYPPAPRQVSEEPSHTQIPSRHR